MSCRSSVPAAGVAKGEQDLPIVPPYCRELPGTVTLALTAKLLHTVAQAWPFGRSPAPHRTSDPEGERFLTDQGIGYVRHPEIISGFMAGLLPVRGYLRGSARPPRHGNATPAQDEPLQHVVRCDVEIGGQEGVGVELPGRVAHQQPANWHGRQAGLIPDGRFGRDLDAAVGAPYQSATVWGSQCVAGSARR